MAVGEGVPPQRRRTLRSVTSAAGRSLHAGVQRPASTMRIRYFPAFWAGNLLQFFCYNMNIIANQWLVTSLTSSRAALGLVGFIQGGMIALTSPFAGVTADRLPKRNVLIVARLLLGVAFVTIGVLQFTARVALWHIWVESILVGLVMSFSEPATQTFVFDIAGRERIQNAIALNSMGAGLAQMTGPALAGVLIAIAGLTATFFSATAGLAVSCLLFLAIPIMGKSQMNIDGAGALSQLREGLWYVRAHPPVMLVLLSCMAAVFNGSLYAMRPIFARDVLQVGSTGYGVMAALGGVGAIIGAVITSALPQTRRPGLQAVATLFLYALCLVLYSFAFSYPYILAVEFTAGFIGQLWQVSIFSGLQTSVPEAMRGRLIGLVFTCVQLTFVGQLGCGTLADLTSDQLALGLFGAIPAVWMALTLLFGHSTLARLHPLTGAE